MAELGHRIRIEGMEQTNADHRAGILAQEMAVRIAREIRLAMEDLAQNHALSVTDVRVDIYEIGGGLTRLEQVRIETSTGGVWHGQNLPPRGEE